MAKKQINKTKSKRRHKNNHRFVPVYIGLTVLILSVIAIKLLLPVPVAAVVNGEKITEAEVNEYYARIPVQLQQVISKSNILDQLINEKLLLQEAAKNNIVTTDSEVNLLIDDAISQSNMTQDEFKQKLKEQNLSLKEMKLYYKQQLTITKLLNQTILNKINLSDQDAMRQATQVYLEQLKNDSEIEIKMPDYASVSALTASASATTQTSTNAVACLSAYNISNTTIIFVHSNSCPHCQKMMPIVKGLEQENYSFYWAESSDQEANTIVNACLSDLTNGYVPQFICPLTGKEKTGEMSQEDLKTFADNCK